MIATEKHYSVKEISEMWGVSNQTVVRMFSDEPGVLKFGRAESLHKRQYMTLRVPESVLERVHAKKN